MKIRLRPAHPGDREAVLAIVGRPDVSATLILDPASSAQTFVETGLRGSSGALYVYVRNGEIIGGGKLENASFSYFVHPDFQGRGHGKAIAGRLLSLLLRRCPAGPVLLTIRRDNSASRSIAEYLGFRFAGADGLSPHCLHFERAAETDIGRAAGVLSPDRPRRRPADRLR